LPAVALLTVALRSLILSRTLLLAAPALYFLRSCEHKAAQERRRSGANE
jgi:hypothetical protein